MSEVVVPPVTPILPTPTGEAFGWVTAIIARAIADTLSDADDKPEFVPSDGTVTFTPVEVFSKRQKPSMGVIREKIVFDIDGPKSGGTGMLRNRETGKVGPQGIWVGLWNVTFQPVSGTIPEIKNLQITAADTYDDPLDLFLAAPYEPPAGTKVTTILLPTQPSSEEVYVMTTKGGVLAWGQLNMVGPQGRSVTSIEDADRDGIATIHYSDSLTEQLALPPGPKGDTGPTVNTSWQGTKLVVGTNPPVDLKGEPGDPGNPGADSTVPGPANVLKIGTVTTGAAGSNASASITGTAPDQTLSLTIPRGPAGPTGPTFGADGSIIAAGRPDVAATMDSATQSAVAAASSGTFFRSTDGPQGAWIWMKRGTTWGVVDGDTGYRNITNLTPGVTRGRIVVRRVPTGVFLYLDDNQFDFSIWGRAVVIPTGFTVRNSYAGVFYAIGGGSQGLFERIDINGTNISMPGAKEGLWLRDYKFFANSGEGWPTTLPGTPA